MHGLLPYVLRRLAWAPLILFIVSLITFALGRFGPGDPARLLAGQNPDPVVIERIREEKGFNDNFFVQYGRYMGNVLQGELGQSFLYRGQDIEDVVFPRLWVTFQYNFVALILVFALGIPAGVWIARHQGSWRDPLSMGGLLFFASIPVLIMIPALQFIFALKLGWLLHGRMGNQGAVRLAGVGALLEDYDHADHCPYASRCGRCGSSDAVPGP